LTFSSKSVTLLSTIKQIKPMGQYHILVNLTKNQFVHPHQIGNGLKLLEQAGWEYSTSTALMMLIAGSSGRGCGDFEGHPLVGSWAGDKIAMIGDYAEMGDLGIGDLTDVKLLYNIIGYVTHDNDNGYIVGNETIFKRIAVLWKNISADVRDMMSAQFNIRYKGNGWMDIEEIKPEEKGKKFAEFQYPSSHWSQNGNYTHRKVEIIEEDDTYIKGLDTGDKNRFKQFRKDKMRGFIGYNG